jgi:putative DNA primase/helicase
MSGDMLAAALAAHDAGLSVVPVRDDGTKRPIGQWKRWQTERADIGQVRAWYQNGRTGLGVVCGRVSGGLEMLEFEGRAIEEGLADLLDVEANAAGLGDLVDRIIRGYCERTPSGGLHLLYRCAETDGSVKLASDENGDVLIETRGEGGFVIVAPSNGTTHPTGRSWELTDGGFHTIDTIAPDERSRLLDLCRRLD